MTGRVHVLSKRVVEKEASSSASTVYDAQAVVRVCMHLVDPDTGPGELTDIDRHTIWRALALADRTLQATAESIDEIGLPA